MQSLSIAASSSTSVSVSMTVAHEPMEVTASVDGRLATTASASSASSPEGPSFHMLELLSLVNRCVAYEFESHTGQQWTDHMKQQPQFSCTLCKLLYLDHPYPIPFPSSALPIKDD